VDVVADADGTGEADDGLIGAGAGDVLARAHGSWMRPSRMIGMILWGGSRMCFTATASFVASGVLGAVGVATLPQVKHRRELLFASLPVLFSVHQAIEGVVWLGL